MDSVWWTRGNCGLKASMYRHEQGLVGWREGYIVHVGDGRMSETFREVKSMAECWSLVHVWISGSLALLS